MVYSLNLSSGYGRSLWSIELRFPIFTNSLNNHLLTSMNNKHVFYPNQRYTSKGEPELGVGILTETSNRLVKIYFPFSNEYRVYAIQSAPLRWDKFFTLTGSFPNVLENFFTAVLFLKGPNNQLRRMFAFVRLA